MKNEKITWSNFGRHPRFWRHTIAWVLMFFLLFFFSFSTKIYYDSIYENFLVSVLNLLQYILSVYLSFYIFERYYKNQRRVLFFLLHIPIFLLSTLFGRILLSIAGIGYHISIWSEVLNWPFTILAIYLMKFAYFGLKTRWELNKLKTQYKQTILNLNKTQTDPQFLIHKLENIKQYNLEDTHFANEAILELADDLRHRIDTTHIKDIPVSSITEKITSSTNINESQETHKYARLRRHAFTWLLLTYLTLMNQLNDLSGDWLTWVYEIPKNLIAISIYALLIYPSIYVYKKLALNKKYLLFIGIQLAILISFILFIYFYRYVMGIPNTDITLGMLALGCCLVIAGAYLVQISYNFFRERNTLQALEIKQMEMDLRLLKAQINPHFLFNILNNIYGTNLENSTKANKYIEGLINILQYQSSSHKKPFISLNEEIQIVKNYIDLEKARVYNCEVNVKEEGDFSKFKIIPLLLLPLIENAFKYGTGVANGVIDITFKQIDNQFQFICSNRIMPSKTTKSSTGIGLDNVQNRLLLRYPNQHRFTTSNNQEIFTTEINLSLNEKF